MTLHAKSRAERMITSFARFLASVGLLKTSTPTVLLLDEIERAELKQALELHVQAQLDAAQVVYWGRWSSLLRSGVERHAETLRALIVRL